MPYSQSGIQSNNSLDNLHSLSLLGIVLFAVLSSQHLFSKIPIFANPNSPTAVMAVLAGCIVALLSYLPIKFLYSGATQMTNNQLISISALIGLICTYFMIFEIEPGLPSISATVLALFLFYYHIDQIPSTQAELS